MVSKTKKTGRNCRNSHHKFGKKRRIIKRKIAKRRAANKILAKKKTIRSKLKFKVKDMDINTGRTLIAILNQKDAQDLDLHSGDRIIVHDTNKQIVCVLDISESDKAVPGGKIGLMEEVLDRLQVKNNDLVSIKFTGKPDSVKHIQDKLNGKELTYDELLHIAKDITNDALTDIEKTYFVASGFLKGFSVREIVDLTKAMVRTGHMIKFKGLTLDKHCIGGVPGNRTTMVVIPIIAAAGFTIPKTSSRAITSPAGTADTMECLAKVELSERKIRSVVRKTHACIVHGGSMNLAPADDKIIDVENPLSIDAEGQLLASVMAKKYSVNANHVLIDIPMGESTKAHNKKEAKHLKKMFLQIGKKLGMNVKVIITDGSHPIGNGIGPLLESEDVMSVLRNDPLAPQDLKNKAIYMAGELLAMTGRFSRRKGINKATELLESGQALLKMKQIIKEQGYIKKPQLGEYCHKIISKRRGKIKRVDNKIIAKIARIAGAPSDKGSGIYLNKNVEDNISENELLYTIYAESQFKLDLAVKLAQKDNGYHY